MADVSEFESKKSETNLVSITEGKKNDVILSLCKILEKFGWKLKPESSSSTQTEVVVQTTTIATGGEIVSKKPDIVRFPDAVAARQDFSSLSLKVEESESAGRPNQLWPVYALGGFMIARWMWARWKEAKDNKKPDNPPPGAEEPNNADD